MYVTQTVICFCFLNIMRFFCNLQKLPSPILENLLVPPFESELKRTSQHARLASNKVAIPLPEAGTSVVPRQRPKGSVQPAHTLPLVAPPSPSPRNTLSSPSIPPPQMDSEPFSAQFQANFPPVSNAIAAVPTPTASQPLLAAISPTSTTVPFPTSQTSNQSASLNVDSDRLENLFQSKFPDPFTEPTTPSVHGSGGLFPLPVQQQEVVMPLELAGTPTKSGKLFLNAPKVGHRRNMSDTTAFNK